MSDTATASSISMTSTGTGQLVDSNGAATNAVESEIGTASVNALAAGDLLLNEVAIRASSATDDTASYTGAFSSDAAASGIAIAAAINASAGDSGVTATVNETVLVGRNEQSLDATATDYAVGDSGSVHINGIDVGEITLQQLDGGAAGDIDFEQARKDAMDKINSKSAQTGVTAEITGEALTLTAADGRNISVAIDNNEAANGAPLDENFGLAIGLDANVDGIGENDITTDGNVERVYETTYSTVTLESAGAMKVETSASGTNGALDSGLNVGTYGGAESGQFIEDIDISTAAGAENAIASIDNALDQISQQRSEFGAVQNRLDFTIDNLNNTVENTTAARSRIEDTDYASESANLSRAQVLQQASQTMLAQANSAPQQVLSLLQ
jgi:flagellin